MQMRADQTAPTKARLNPKVRARQDFVRRFVPVEDVDILEIGAFASPTFIKPDHHVVYADRLSTATLKRSTPDEIKRNAIVDVDFVVDAVIDSSSIDARFDLVVANHVIEHVPNFIGWLLGVSSLLRPGGSIFMAIPDRNYTFDKLRDLTTLRELMLLHEIRATRPPLSHVTDHKWGYRPINLGSEVWTRAFEEKLEAAGYASYGAAYEASRAIYTKYQYLDCHCNVFTAETWQGILTSLVTLEWFPFTLTGVQEVLRPYNEFLTILTLKADRYDDEP